MYKLPKKLVNYQDLKRYVCEYDSDYINNGLRIYKKSEYVLIDINISEEERLWIEDENNISSDLIGIRQDILEGDYRPLFMIWLHIKKLEYDEEQLNLKMKIPFNLIPDDLNKSNRRLESLTDLYEINKDWIKAISKFSLRSKSETKMYLDQIRELPLDTKNEFLERILKGELNLDLILKKRN